MNQSDLYREIANVTKESVGFIRSMGFSLVVVPDRPKPRLARQLSNRKKARHLCSLPAA